MRLTLFLLGTVLGLGALFTSTPLAHSSVGRDILRTRKTSSRFGGQIFNLACEDWKKLVSSSELPNENWADKLRDSFSTDPAKVFFIGEYHDDYKAKIHLPEIVHSLHHPGRAECLFIEFPKSRDAIFENISANARDQNKVLQKILARFKSNLPVDGKPIWPWILAATEAKSLGMKVISFDAAQRDKDLAYEVSEKNAMQFRNRTMSDTLIHFHESGECEFSITLNGISHLVSNSSDGSLKNLPKILKEHGLRVHSLFLRSAEVARNDLRFKPACDWTREIKNPIFMSGPTAAPLFTEVTLEDSLDFGEIEPYVFDSEQSLLIF
jgi:hypothetical protein